MSNTPTVARGAVAVTLLLFTLVLRSAPLAHAESCQFVLGFKSLHELMPGIVGDCMDDEQHNAANGDALQHTTGGLLVWHKADNHTAFTDGHDTWVNGPKGLEFRLNSVRFPWEANPQGLPVGPDASVGAAQFVQQPGPTLRVEPPIGEILGSLSFRVTGSGFVPGETVALNGTGTPDFLVRTGNPESPVEALTCPSLTLEPVRVVADNGGSVTATFQVPNAYHGGYDVRATATGLASGRTASGGTGGGTRPVLDAIPAGCHT